MNYVALPSLFNGYLPIIKSISALLKSGNHDYAKLYRQHKKMWANLRPLFRQAEGKIWRMDGRLAMAHCVYTKLVLGSSLPIEELEADPWVDGYTGSRGDELVKKPMRFETYKRLTKGIKLYRLHPGRIECHNRHKSILVQRRIHFKPEQIAIPAKEKVVHKVLGRLDAGIPESDRFGNVPETTIVQLIPGIRHVILKSSDARFLFRKANAYAVGTHPQLDLIGWDDEDNSVSAQKDYDLKELPVYLQPVLEKIEEDDVEFIYQQIGEDVREELSVTARDNWERIDGKWVFKGLPISLGTASWSLQSTGEGVYQAVQKMAREIAAEKRAEAFKIIKYLLSHKLSPATRDRGWTAWREAKGQSDREMVQTWLESRIEVRHGDSRMRLAKWLELYEEELSNDDTWLRDYSCELSTLDQLDLVERLERELVESFIEYHPNPTHMRIYFETMLSENIPAGGFEELHKIALQRARSLKPKAQGRLYSYNRTEDSFWVTPGRTAAIPAGEALRRIRFGEVKLQESQVINLRVLMADRPDWMAVLSAR